MGYSLVWTAVKGKPIDEVLQVCGLEVTGVREEIQESKYTVAMTPERWVVIIADHDGDWLVNPSLLQLVSASAQAVTCEVEEYAMVSRASGWENGVQKWSVLHDCQNRKSGLVETGVLPPNFLEIRKALEAKQTAAGGRAAKVDYIFDAPVKLARELTGFRHDEDIPAAGKDPFEVLRKVSAPPLSKPSLLKRLFGS